MDGHAHHRSHLTAVPKEPPALPCGRPIYRSAPYHPPTFPGSYKGAVSSSYIAVRDHRRFPLTSPTHRIHRGFICVHPSPPPRPIYTGGCERCLDGVTPQQHKGSDRDRSPPKPRRPSPPRQSHHLPAGVPRSGAACIALLGVGSAAVSAPGATAPPITQHTSILPRHI